MRGAALPAAMLSVLSAMGSNVQVVTWEHPKTSELLTCCKANGHFRMVLPAGVLATSERFRVQFHWGGGDPGPLGGIGSGTDYVIDAIAIGKQDGSGPDMVAGTIAPITFAGATSNIRMDSQTKFTDWIGYTMDANTAYVLSWFVRSGPDGYARWAPANGVKTWVKTGASSADVSKPSSGVVLVEENYIYDVSSIQQEATPPTTTSSNRTNTTAPSTTSSPKSTTRRSIKLGGSTTSKGPSSKLGASTTPPSGSAVVSSSFGLAPTAAVPLLLVMQMLPLSPWLSFGTTVYEAFILLASLAGMLVGALGIKQWTSKAENLGGFLSSYKQYAKFMENLYGHLLDATENACVLAAAAFTGAGASSAQPTDNIKDGKQKVQDDGNEKIA